MGRHGGLEIQNLSSESHTFERYRSICLKNVDPYMIYIRSIYVYEKLVQNRILKALKIFKVL